MLRILSTALAMISTIALATPAFTAEPSQTGYAEVNGLNMYHETHGTGKPTVVIQGAYMSAESMAPMIDGLATTRQVIAMDLQGHGRTANIDRPITYEQMADDVARLMVRIRVAQADVFGYSMGAGVAYQLAIRHPARLHRLAAASGTYKTEGMYPELVEMIERMTADFFAGSPMEAEYKKLAPNPEDFPKLVEKLVELDTTPQDWPEEDMRAIAAPTLIISADTDVVRPEHSVEIFRLRGGGPSQDFMKAGATELAVLPATTHIGVMERTDLLVSMVTAFLDKEIKHQPAKE